MSKECQDPCEKSAARNLVATSTWNYNYTKPLPLISTNNVVEGAATTSNWDCSTSCLAAVTFIKADDLSTPHSMSHLVLKNNAHWMEEAQYDGSPPSNIALQN